MFGRKNPQRAEQNRKMRGKNHPNFGKKCPEETRIKISKATEGIPKPKPTGFGEKISKIKKEYFKTHDGTMKGKHHILKTKEKISKTIIKKGICKGENNPNAKLVILISPKRKEYKVFCYKLFCEKYHLDRGYICRVLQGKQKQHKEWTGYYSETLNNTREVKQ